MRIGTVGGLLLSLAAWPLTAQEVAREWLPEEIRLPDDMEVMVDRALGPSHRLFSFRTGADVEALLVEWRRALTHGGYVVDASESSETTREIEFGGAGIEGAKIAVTPSGEWKRALVEIASVLES